MRNVALLLNDMLQAGVILDYALFGAAAQMRYTEPVATLDADVLVSVPPPDRLDVLRLILEFCAGKGYRPEGEAVRVGAWPVQFIMDDIQEMLQRQAEWQRARKSLSWPEKIRMVEAIRESIVQLRRTGPTRPDR